MSLDAMKQALEALELEAAGWDSVSPVTRDAIIALLAAIEEAEKQEPVAWMFVNTDGECEQIEYIKDEPMPDDPSVTPLYTAPRQWQGLTNEEVSEILDREIGFNSCFGPETNFARAIEAKLKEKNR